MQLIVGANTRQEPGWTHHDVKPYPGIDIVCDIWDLPQHAKDCTKIQMTHVLEHFGHKETIPLLEMLKSLLVPRGELYLEVPNFAWHAELVLQGQAEKAVYYAFGGQLDEWDFHKTGFTPTILQARLEEAGFTDINIDGWDTLTATCNSP